MPLVKELDSAQCPSHFHIPPPPTCLNPPPPIGQAEDKGLSKDMGGAAKSWRAVMSNRAQLPSTVEPTNVVEHTPKIMLCRTLFLQFLPYFTLDWACRRSNLPMSRGHDPLDQDTKRSPSTGGNSLCRLTTGKNMYHPPTPSASLYYFVPIELWWSSTLLHYDHCWPHGVTWTTRGNTRGNMNHTCPT